MSDWTTARSAHGQKVAAFIDNLLEEREIGAQCFGDAFARNLHRLRHGSHASFFAVDRMLSKIDVHPCELPDDVWLDCSVNWAARKLAEAA